MSYGPPPKTAYGDQDFIKEDIIPQTPSFAPPPSPPQQQYTGNYQLPDADPYSQPSPYGQLPVGQQAIGAGYPPPPSNLAANPNVNPIAAATQSMTQEDILFMKSWRQDTFYRRVLPIATIANGGYYYYNHTKGLPHKPIRHVLLSGVCYFLGVWSARGDLRRRIMESSSNTPFMQAMKKYTGQQGQASEFQDATMVFQNPSAGWSTTSDGFSRRPYPPPQAPSPYSSPSPAATMSLPYNQPSMDQYEPTNYGSYDSGLNNPDTSRDSHRNENGDLAQKSITSYEELRARNRGLLPPK